MKGGPHRRAQGRHKLGIPRAERGQVLSVECAQGRLDAAPEAGDAIVNTSTEQGDPGPGADGQHGTPHRGRTSRVLFIIEFGSFPRGRGPFDVVYPHILMETAQPR